MNLLKLPLFTELAEADNILLAGAGGGYDIFCGLPLYFALKAAGKKVHLANLSFSFLPPLNMETRLSPSLYTVTADTPVYGGYFPEKYLAEWFRQQGEEVPIYAFERMGFKPLFASYQALVKELALDVVILIDGGTDSLMRGDEAGLGTPHEDITSIAVVDELEVTRKLMVCLGFGIDSFHGVCHAHFLEGVAAVIQTGGYLGAFSLLQDRPEVQRYQAASRYVFERMPNDISIVSSSIISAIEGHYGNYHATPRTRHSKLWINPLMSLYWCFRLPQVAQRILYLNQMKQTESYSDVQAVISRFKQSRPTVRPWENIPV